MTGAHNPGNGCFKSQRKQPTFPDATTGFPAKKRYYPELDSASDLSGHVGTLLQPIKSTTQF